MSDKTRGMSNVNVVPRSNNILIRMEFKTSILDIQSDKPTDDHNEDIRMYVAGFGPLVTDIELNEEVLLELVKAYTSVDVKDNFKSFKELQKTYRSMKPSEFTKLLRDPETAKVDVVQYGMFPEYIIKAHVE